MLTTRELVNVGSNASPSVSIGDASTGFYISSGKVCFSISGVPYFKFSNGLQLLKQDKNTSANASSGFNKLIANTDNTLAQIGSSTSSVVTGVFFPKVPAYDFSLFSLDQLVLYLNNLRTNNGTQTVTMYTPSVVAAVAGSYVGACYVPTNNYVVLIPYSMNTESDIDYILSDGTTSTFSWTAGLTAGYAGGCYSDDLNRIYLIPYGQGTSGTWAYINCGTVPSCVTYSSGVTTVTSAYLGGCMDPVNKRIFMAPYNQAVETNWHYINSKIGIVSTYADATLTVTAPLQQKMYSGSVTNPNTNRAYFVPYNPSGDSRYYAFQYMDASRVIHSFAIAKSSCVLHSNAFIDGAYCSNLDRIYFAPYNQLIDNGVWYYLDCGTGTMNAAVVNDPGDPSYEIITPRTYFGAVYSSGQDRIYFIPHAQAVNPFWHYVDCTDGQIYTYNVGVTGIESGGYAGGCYVAFSDRVYLAPYAQSDQTDWHYINCADNTLVTYTNTSTTVKYAYIGAASGIADTDAGVPSVYLVPYAQANELKYYYVFTGDNTQGVYHEWNPGNQLVYGAYAGCVNTSTHIFLTPCKQGQFSTWNAIRKFDRYFFDITGAAGDVGAGSSFDDGSYLFGSEITTTSVYFGPCYQSGNTNWCGIDNVFTISGFTYTGTISLNIPQPITTNIQPVFPHNQYMYVGILYSSTSNKAFFVPFNNTSTNDTLQYVDGTNGNIVSYPCDQSYYASMPAYAGGAYCTTTDTVYFAPYGTPMDGTVNILSVICSTNTVVSVPVDVVVSSSNHAYFGGVYSATQNKIYFVPYGQGPYTYWHYIDCATGHLVPYLNNMNGATAVVDNAYVDGCYVPGLDRIYFAPYGQSDQLYWHYIDCVSGEVVAYLNGAGASSNAYAGAAYLPTLDRVYFAPFMQAPEANWHYINCVTELVVAYTNNISTYDHAYCGAVYAYDRILFVPSGQAQASNWAFIETDGSIQTYFGVASVSGAGTTPEYGAYALGCLIPGLERLYMAPSAQGNQSDWAYIATNVVLVQSVSYSLDTTYVPVLGAYSGCIYSPVEQRVYFSPYNQAVTGYSAYINCATNVLEIFACGSGFVSAAYISGVYSATQNRIYFIPYMQCTEDYWHYVDCTSGTVVAYLHGATCVAGGYYGGVYSPTQNRIYFVPYLQANQTYWHYIDCDTGVVVAYLSGVTCVSAAYTGGCYSPVLDRVVFAPYNQGVESDWHYIKTSNLKTVSRTYSSGALMSKL